MSAPVWWWRLVHMQHVPVPSPHAARTRPTLGLAARARKLVKKQSLLAAHAGEVQTLAERPSESTSCMERCGPTHQDLSPATPGHRTTYILEKTTHAKKKQCDVCLNLYFSIYIKAPSLTVGARSQLPTQQLKRNHDHGRLWQELPGMCANRGA